MKTKEGEETKRRGKNRATQEAQNQRRKMKSIRLNVEITCRQPNARREKGKRRDDEEEGDEEERARGMQPKQIIIILERHR